MPRIMYLCRYLKNSTPQKRSNLVSYIALRDGVVKLTDTDAELPATEKQKRLVARLLREFPAAIDSFEYEDYVENPTQGNASEFIRQTIESNMDALEERKNFVDYIATRPRVGRLGAHGLFTDAGVPLVLSQVQDEVATHPGNIWTNVVSLRREDATRLGYDNAAAWRSLLRAQRNVLAESMKVAPNNLRWFAAYHDEGHHPHVHLMAYSVDPTEAYVTQQGIEKMRSSLAREIFKQDLIQVYERQTKSRDALSAQSKDVFRQCLAEIQTGVCENAEIERGILLLAARLRNTKGKKQYGYLKPDVKTIIDRIVDELGKDERIARLYSEWLEQRAEVLKTYADKPQPFVPLSQEPTFKAVKNMVITEAVQIGTEQFIFEPDDHADSDAEPQKEDTPIEGDSQIEDEMTEPNAEWSDTYKLARQFFYGHANTPRDFAEARRLALPEAAAGNALAMHDLGRIYADGLGVEPDADTSRDWYAKALTAFRAVENEKSTPYVEYRIGKMYNAGLGTDQDHEQAALWFGMAADANNKYAQYSLAALFLKGLGVERDDAMAFSLYRKAAVRGNAYASWELANLYRDGIGTERDAELADAQFRTAFNDFCKMDAADSDDRLQYRIGKMHLDGLGTEQDEAAAILCFETAAELGNAHAQFALAKLYIKNGADDETVQRAVEWLSNLSLRGNTSAQYALAKLYLAGERVDKDSDKAVELLLHAAEHGHEYAMYRLGKLYLAGDDVPRDVGAAVRWFTAAADQKNQYAQYRLGKLYLVGEGVPKDVDAAIHYLTASAEQGNQYAQYTLGKLYLMGRDITRDHDTAVKWLTLSAEQGNQYAAFFLERADQFRNPSAMLAASRLMYQLSQLINRNQPTPRRTGTGYGADSKVRRKIREKKIALGHAEDEREPEQTY